MFSIKSWQTLTRFLPHLQLKRSKVYVTGIQPTGIPHIGNYLGFIQNSVQLQVVKFCSRIYLVCVKQICECNKYIKN